MKKFNRIFASFLVVSLMINVSHVVCADIDSIDDSVEMKYVAELLSDVTDEATAAVCKDSLPVIHSLGEGLLVMTAGACGVLVGGSLLYLLNGMSDDQEKDKENATADYVTKEVFEQEKEKYIQELEKAIGGLAAADDVKALADKFAKLIDNVNVVYDKVTDVNAVVQAHDHPDYGMTLQVVKAEIEKEIGQLADRLTSVENDVYEGSGDENQGDDREPSPEF